MKKHLILFTMHVLHEPSYINEFGHVISWSQTSAGETHSSLWMAGAMVNLNDLVESDIGTLMYAFDINEMGQIAGIMISSAEGLKHSFLLTPQNSQPIPEPTMLILPSFCLFGLAGLRRGNKIRLPIFP